MPSGTKRKRLIRIDEVKGAPARISPIVSRLFAESLQSVWLFDAIAPYEPPSPAGSQKTAAMIHL